MAKLTIQSLASDTYRITITDSRSSSVHEVTADGDQIKRLGQGASAEEVIEASFRFLLEREPKESILGRFDLSIISRYFPEYEARVGDYL